MTSNQKYLYLENNLIKDNYAIIGTGGLHVYSYFINIFFSEENRSSIYNNYAATVSDLSLAKTANNPEVYLDTFSFAEPDFYSFNVEEEHSFEFENYTIEEIDADLYVAPDGDDNNSGLTPEEPLRTIAHAQTIIKRNAANPHTIFLAAGSYSPSLNNQRLPLNIKHGTTLQGISPAETIIDGEDQFPFVTQIKRHQEFATFTIKDLSFVNGRNLRLYKPGISIHQADLHLDNVHLTHCKSDDAVGPLSLYNGYSRINRLTVSHNNAKKAVNLFVEGLSPNPVRNDIIINSRINSNTDCLTQDPLTGGGGMSILSGPELEGDFQAKIINCEINENHDSFYSPQTNEGGTSALFISRMDNVQIVNTTIGNNTIGQGEGQAIKIIESNVDIYNSIIHGNEGRNFRLVPFSNLSIKNSLVEGGEENMYTWASGTDVTYFHGSCLEEDPLWAGAEAEWPYALTAASPCIDTGTLDLPDGIELPEYDLAGNPRIYGAGIDMGAYEFQGEPQAAEEEEIIIPQQTKISNYPNPFSPSNSARGSSTTISLELVESGKTELSIYNSKGQKIKDLSTDFLSMGRYNFAWDGKDNQGRAVASGTYIIKLRQNNLGTARKMLVVK
jgi:hypothetical protein